MSRTAINAANAANAAINAANEAANAAYKASNAAINAAYVAAEAAKSLRAELEKAESDLATEKDQTTILRERCTEEADLREKAERERDEAGRLIQDFIDEGKSNE